MIPSNSILNSNSNSALIDKIQENYNLPFDSILHSGSLKTLKEKNNRNNKSNEFFVLTKDYLFCLDDSPTEHDDVMKFRTKSRIALKWVLCNFYIKESSNLKKFYIELVKNNKKIIYDAIDRHGYDKWREVLKPRVLQYNFRSAYYVENLISIRKNNKLFKLVDKSNNSVYFAEKFKKEKMSDEKVLTQFTNKINILQQLLDCEGVSQLHELYETDNSIYVVYKPYFGGPVFNHNFVYPPKTFLKILRNILAVLKLLELKDISHGYLRPKNIYFKHSHKLIEDNEIIITDFSHSQKIEKDSSRFKQTGRRESKILGQESGATVTNSDIVDLGLVALNYLYYAQYNKSIGINADYESIILNPTFMISTERKLIS